MLVSLRLLTAAAYRLGIGPHPSDHPDRGLAEVVEGAPRLPPGRALDLGCGTGRNAIYLARHGWQVTGVDLAGSVLDVARRKAAEAGVAVRLVRGDVTRLGELNLGEGYLLLMDGGCYHMVPMSRRDAYVDGITRAAAPGAFLIMVGFSHHRFTGGGVTAEDLRHRFSGWELTHGPDPVPAAEMLDYVSGPAPVRSAIRRGWLTASRFQLRRTSTGFGPIG
jgi:SAM-dependent methyltransferase